MIDWLPAVAPLEDNEVAPAKVVMDGIIVVRITAPGIRYHRHATLLVAAFIAV